ncbi:bifunctional diaminohydroxyphosphoribosylaminopyrimidine deaminase/5-amino-6-(5-phosphoribosylamino)uracil reductase RibD [uncultured Maribacter sp.]|uniref:bifunctional diaminohydroxyphosphoribosylaminopyrimidine deaminase/5-amino-6-(5-phosphoribosylamino)uracil reductase RibD n=1 Tax=uncultured Maribacter sp. TaxID=431308 RepID=UPI00261E288E|nr:bifunctional diaminohydroxyphosphoribosylaminopyrimidine deaminase/5-amino-6-(5-phosphoribosylamino)uracil reductase RibD [uncultured Maribacter sp.]
MKIHEKYMLRCIELGKNGLGNTAPNPMVGSVIVYNNKIIGEGYTSPYGGSHAEVSAINSITDISLLKEATLYVTLEPCSHYGKTPPCADLIIKHQIKTVVIGTLDPNEKVAGKGIKKLKEAGCNVITPILEKECKEHHKRFLTFFTKKRPYIILKWAETKDGFIAPNSSKRKVTPEPFWITNTFSRQIVHKWRAEEQAILVGTNTAIQDNPKLDTRKWKGKNPTRIVLDKNLKVKQDFHLLDNKTNTIVFTENKLVKNIIPNINYEIVSFDASLAKHICNSLHRRNINSVIIEGGTKTIQTFIDSKLWDEARIFIGNTSFKEGIKAPIINNEKGHTKQLLKDQLYIIKND